MKPKQLALVVVLALVLGGLGYYITRRNQASYVTSGAGQGQKLQPAFPLNDIARVQVREGTNELALVKEGDLWRVRERAGYAANFAEVGDLLRKIWELKAVQTEEIGSSQLARLQLLEPGQGTNGAVRVEFQDAAGKTVAALLLGKKHMRKGGGPSPMGGMGGDDAGWPDGRWVQDASRPTLAALVSEPFTEVEGKPERWLNKDFFKVEKLKSIAVVHPEATNSWKVYRESEGGELKLADPQGEEVLDTGKASSVGNALAWPSFVDVRQEGAGLEQPVVATLETFDGFTYTVKAAAAGGTDENYGLKVSVTAELTKERAAGADEKPEDKERLDKEFADKLVKLGEKLKTEKGYEPWVYTVSKWTIDPILKKRHELLQDKKAEGEAAQPGVGGAEAPLLPDVGGHEDHDHGDEGQ